MIFHANLFQFTSNMNLKHQNIIPLQHILRPQNQSENALYITSPMHEMGDLLNVVTMHMENNTKINTVHVMLILNQLSGALAYVHSKDMVHGNLKLSNCIVISATDEDIAIAIRDFALPPEIRISTDINNNKGSNDHLAPEVSLRVFERQKEADIWALGVVMSMLMSPSTVKLLHTNYNLSNNRK